MKYIVVLGDGMADTPGEALGGKTPLQVANKPVYTATLVKYADLICNKPSGQAQITGIAEK